MLQSEGRNANIGEMKRDVKNSDNKGLLLFTGVFALIGLIIAATQTKYLQNPGSNWIFIIIALVALGVAAFGYANRWFGKASQIIFIAACFLYAIAVFAAGSSAKSNRESGIPSEVLIHSNGHIPDAEAYIKFHEKNGSENNKVLMDDETKAYIRKNSELPSWVVIGGYTKDAVQWVAAHPGASQDTKSRVLSSGKVGK